jgi:hypothetical protein
MRVLAIDAFWRGFGYVVFEGPGRIVCWGVKEARDGATESLRRQFSRILKLYQPEILVFEDLKNGRYAMNTKDRVLGQIEIARAEGLKDEFIVRSEVSEHFADRGAKNRHDIACLIAEDLPELARSLPPRRKAGDNEDVRIRIFGAAALALTFYASKRRPRQRQRG